MAGLHGRWMGNRYSKVTNIFIIDIQKFDLAKLLALIGFLVG